MKSKKYGKIFWITGLSGSDKSTIGEKLKTLIKNKYGKTIIIHGDDIRNIYVGLIKYQLSLKLFKNFFQCINQAN